MELHLKINDVVGMDDEKRHRQDEIAKQRRRDQFIASQNYRKSVDYIHNVLGWNNDNGAGE